MLLLLLFQQSRRNLRSNPSYDQIIKINVWHDATGIPASQYESLVVNALSIIIKIAQLFSCFVVSLSVFYYSLCDDDLTSLKRNNNKGRMLTWRVRGRDPRGMGVIPALGWGAPGGYEWVM